MRVFVDDKDIGPSPARLLWGPSTSRTVRSSSLQTLSSHRCTCHRQNDKTDSPNSSSSSSSSSKFKFFVALRLAVFGMTTNACSEEFAQYLAVKQAIDAQELLRQPTMDSDR